MQVVLFMSTTCVLVYMSGLVCMCNDPAHPHTHPGTHSSSLCLCDSTMVAAVLSLLGRWGWCAWRVWQGSVQWGGVWSLRDVRPSETPRWQKQCHAEGGEMEIVLSINCWNKAPRVFTGPNLPQWSDVPITWRRGEENRKSDAAEQPQTNSILLS